jgi:Holliday junction resolvasome RuvABC endonuclease subunit
MTANKIKNLISIDSSTNSIAFAHFIDLDLYKYGKITFSGQNAYYKTGDACKKINAYAKLHKIENVIIESAIYANSPKTAIQLSLVQGAILGSLSLNGAKKITPVSPIQWQNWIGNKRLTQQEKETIVKNNPNKSNSWYKSQERLFRKQRTINLVNNKFNIKVTDDDVADSIAIGWFACNNWSKLNGS